MLLSVKSYLELADVLLLAVLEAKRKCDISLHSVLHLAAVITNTETTPSTDSSSRARRMLTLTIIA